MNLMHDKCLPHCGATSGVWSTALRFQTGGEIQHPRHSFGGGERPTDRQRQTETETDRQTQRQRQTDRERHRHRQKDTETDRDKKRQANRRTDRQRQSEWSLG